MILFNWLKKKPAIVEEPVVLSDWRDEEIERLTKKVEDLEYCVTDAESQGKRWRIMWSNRVNECRDLDKQIRELQDQVRKQSDMKENLAEENAKLKEILNKVRAAIPDCVISDERLNRGDTAVCVDSENTEEELTEGQHYRVRGTLKCGDVLLVGHAYSYSADRFRKIELKTVVKPGDKVRRTGDVCQPVMIVTDCGDNYVECGRHGCFDPAEIVVVSQCA